MFHKPMQISLIRINWLSMRTAAEAKKKFTEFPKNPSNSNWKL